MEVQIEHRLTEVEDRSKSNQHRLDELEKRQDNLDDLVSTVKVLAVREETVENDVKEIKEDVKKLAFKPGQMWDSLVKQVVTALVAALVGYFVAQFLH
jgi:predicted  nucleic acid-binding Zn-ribbon protein